MAVIECLSFSKFSANVLITKLLILCFNVWFLAAGLAPSVAGTTAVAGDPLLLTTAGTGTWVGVEALEE